MLNIAFITGSSTKYHQQFPWKALTQLAIASLRPASSRPPLIFQSIRYYQSDQLISCDKPASPELSTHHMSTDGPPSPYLLIRCRTAKATIYRRLTIHLKLLCSEGSTIVHFYPVLSHDTRPVRTCVQHNIFNHIFEKGTCISPIHSF